MRILYISQYFPPEAGATQSRSFDMAKCWADLGHQLTILTEFPNHPSGIIPSNYKGKWFERTKWESLEILRVWVKTSPRKNYQTRMAFYLSFMMNAIIAGLFLTRRNYDFIYATSPPLFVGGAALALHALKHIPMVFEVRDLWPESAIALGELSDPRSINLASRLEEMCYRKAGRIVVVTRGIYDYLINKNIPAEKLIIIPNGANVEMFTFKPSERERIRKELGLEGKFVCVYAGILGLAQGIETIIEAANLLKSSPGVHFLLIGDGPRKAEITSLVKSYNLLNLTILPEKPREEVPGYLSAADLAIVPLRKTEIFKGVLPSKIFDAWACERPVLVSIDGEARQLVEGVQGGAFIPPEDPQQLAVTLLKLMKSPDELLKMGRNGSAYTRQNHNRQELAVKLITELAHFFKN